MLRVRNKTLGRCLELSQSSRKIIRGLHKVQQNHENDPKSSKTSKRIRKEFLDYFTRLDHKFIPPSRVSPIFDPSVAFTNAGMNQFKPIFLDKLSPPHPRAVNHQKCIRVGGKHNDLKAVGTDSHHHTFFEMLGSWSFGDYGKREACSYAWGLLTGPFGIASDRLCVTYFGGDESLDLPADLECRDVWRSLGVPEDRILPFGVDENFWEMGLTGPCGPCTEIHVARGNFEAPRGLSGLQELWNVVFIEYQRLPDGSVVPLSRRHVDTGMGFERLVAVLQEKESNYDTDLFAGIFEGIRRCSGAPAYSGRFGAADENGVDTGYRVLADHGRMVTVALADGMAPEENHKVRRVLRKAVNVGLDTFKRDGILGEVCCHVAEALGDVYPELRDNLNHVRAVVSYEEELLKSLKQSSGKQWLELVAVRPSLGNISDPYAPGLLLGYKELQRSLGDAQRGKIPGEVAFKLYDTYGLDPEMIEELCDVEGLQFDRTDFDRCMENAKLRSKVGIAQVERRRISDDVLQKLGNIQPTDDSLKYQYSFENERYVFPVVRAKILAILVNGELIAGNSLKLSEAPEDSEIGVILDRTCLYTTEGGQQSDKGHLHVRNLLFNVSTVIKTQSYVLHLVNFRPDSCNTQQNVELFVGDAVELSINEDRRVALMRHHTATHLLNSALRRVLPAVCQRGSIVRENHLIFQFSAYGKTLSAKDAKTVEQIVNDCIEEKVPVTARIINSLQFTHQRDVILVPGEIYPEENLRIVEVAGEKLKSKEACCGTHVHNTGVLNRFKIVEITSKGRSSRTIKAVVGPQAENLRSKSKDDTLEAAALASAGQSDPNKRREIVQDWLIGEINSAVKSAGYTFVVHYLEASGFAVESIPLQLVGEFCPDRPIFLVSRGNRKVRARCFVPKQFVSSDFNAELWMKAVNEVLKQKIGSFADENPELTSHTRVSKLATDEIDEKVAKSLEVAQNFAVRNFQKS